MQVFANDSMSEAESEGFYRKLVLCNDAYKTSITSSTSRFSLYCAQAAQQCVLFMISTFIMAGVRQVESCCLKLELN